MTNAVGDGLFERTFVKGESKNGDSGPPVRRIVFVDLFFDASFGITSDNTRCVPTEFVGRNIGQLSVKRRNNDAGASHWKGLGESVVNDRHFGGVYNGERIVAKFGEALL